MRRTAVIQKVVSSQARAVEGLATQGESGVQLARELLSQHPLNLEEN